MIRTLYPVDLLPLFFSLGRMPPNQAITSDSLSELSPTSPRAIIEHWIPLTNRRQTWLFLERGRIRGLASVRAWPTSSTWRVDCVHGDGRFCLALLDKVSATAARKGVRKLFLRVASGSLLLDEARRCGFKPYNIDYFYRYSGTPVVKEHALPKQYNIRPVSRNDLYALFELYRSTVPAQVRLAEGITLNDWQETRARPYFLDQHRDFILAIESRLAAWIHLGSAGRTGCFNVLFHQLDDEGLDLLVSHALLYLCGKSPIFCVVSSSQTRLLTLLERLEFERLVESMSLVKEITVRVTEPRFVPMRA